VPAGLGRDTRSQLQLDRRAPAPASHRRRGRVPDWQAEWRSSPIRVDHAAVLPWEPSRCADAGNPVDLTPRLARPRPSCRQPANRGQQAGCRTGGPVSPTGVRRRVVAFAPLPPRAFARSCCCSPACQAMLAARTRPRATRARGSRRGLRSGGAPPPELRRRWPAHSVTSSGLSPGGDRLERMRCWDRLSRAAFELGRRSRPRRCVGPSRDACHASFAAWIGIEASSAACPGFAARWLRFSA